MYRRFDLAKSYISSRNASSPVQRQISATALGNLAVSSVLPASALAPKYTEPSVTTSWTTLPEESLSLIDASLRPRRCSLIGSNWPRATDAKAVNSPSVANSHG